VFLANYRALQVGECLCHIPWVQTDLFNQGAKLPTIAEVHRWWKDEQKGKAIIKLHKSLEKITPPVEDTGLSPPVTGPPIITIKLSSITGQCEHVIPRIMRAFEDWLDAPARRTGGHGLYEITRGIRDRGYEASIFRLEIEFQDTCGDGLQIDPFFWTRYSTGNLSKPSSITGNIPTAR
jgi:hypothetical protein